MSVRWRLNINHTSGSESYLVWILPSGNADEVMGKEKEKSSHSELVEMQEKSVGWAIEAKNPTLPMGHSLQCPGQNEVWAL